MSYTQVEAAVYDGKDNTAIITNAPAWGLIPSFFDPDDERLMHEQFDEAYIGGWRPHPDLKYEIKDIEEVNRSQLNCTTYPEDMPYPELGRLYRGDEMAILFTAGMVAWIHYSGSDIKEIQVSRMD